MNPQDPAKDQADPRQSLPPQSPAAMTPATPLEQPVSPEEAERGFYHQENAPAPVAQPSPSYAPAPNYTGYAPAPTQVAVSSHRSVSWTASEFIAHEKNSMWYVALGGGTLVLAALVLLITRDLFSAVIVAIGGVLFGVAASRPPRQMQYAVDDHGITIGARSYPYSDFRAFSVAQEGPFKSLTFMPLKRFMPPLSAYYDPADEDKIAEVLTGHLPMQDHHADPLEKLMRRIRF